VDLDLDFTPNLSLEEMKTAREMISEALKKYMLEEGYTLSASSRYCHSLDSMLFQHQNAGGNRDSIKIGSKLFFAFSYFCTYRAKDSDKYF